MADLIERLEKATEGAEVLDVAVCRAICNYGPDDPLWHVMPYTRSLDAAMTLVPEGHAVDLADCPEMGSVARVYFGPIRENSAGEPTGRGNTPALALTIAALKARESSNG